jgi:hypothetical protein
VQLTIAGTARIASRVRIAGSIVPQSGEPGFAQDCTPSPDVEESVSSPSAANVVDAPAVAFGWTLTKIGAHGPGELSIGAALLALGA